jgi:hypothetical protein
MQQLSFLDNENLLPYRETITVRGRKYHIHVEERGPNYRGERFLSAGFESERPDSWGSTGPYPIDSDVMTLVAQVKARIYHGPYATPEAELMKRGITTDR